MPLYPLNVYRCPNGHEDFYSYAYGGAVCWCCPDCGEQGIWLRCDGDAGTWLRAPRPVKAVSEAVS